MFNQIRLSFTSLFFFYIYIYMRLMENKQHSPSCRTLSLLHHSHNCGVQRDQIISSTQKKKKEKLEKLL